MNTKKVGAVLAISAAGLFASTSIADANTTTTAQPVASPLNCEVSVSCNGSRGCHSKIRFTVNSEKECSDQGGRVVE